MASKSVFMLVMEPEVFANVVSLDTASAPDGQAEQLAFEAKMVTGGIVRIESFWKTVENITDGEQSEASR